MTMFKEISSDRSNAPAASPAATVNDGSACAAAARGIGDTSSSIAPAVDASPSLATAPSSSPSSSTPAKESPLVAFKGFFTKPDRTVLKHPVKSLILNVVIKALAFLVAETFPLIGWVAISFSACLFERVVILNPRKYLNRIHLSALDVWEKWRSKKPATTTPPAATDASSSASAS